MIGDKKHTVLGSMDRPDPSALDDERRLPPRRVIHPNDASKWSRVFQFSLVLMLCMLIAGMVIWYHVYSDSDQGVAAVSMELGSTNEYPFSSS